MAGQVLRRRVFRRRLHDPRRRLPAATGGTRPPGVVPAQRGDLRLQRRPWCGRRRGGRRRRGPASHRRARPRWPAARHRTRRGPRAAPGRC
jgi:hypothetical protein